MVKKYNLSCTIRWANILNYNHPQRYGVCDTSESLTSAADASVYSSGQFAVESSCEKWSVWDHELYCLVSDPLVELASQASHIRSESGVPAVWSRLFDLSETVAIYHFLATDFSRQMANDTILTVHTMSQRGGYSAVRIVKSLHCADVEFISTPGRG